MCLGFDACSFRSQPPLIVCDEKQDYGFYGGGGGGGGGQGSRMYRNAQRGFNGGNEFLLEPSTPPGPGNSRSRKNNGGGGGEDSPGGDFSPGLLDLHSFDTELLPEVWGLLTFSTICILMNSCCDNSMEFVNLTWVLTLCKCFLVWVLSKCQYISLFIREEKRVFSLIN